MATGYPSGTNTFIPSFEGSGKLTVEFSRNVADFSINSYMQIIPVDLNAGYFLKLDPDEAARVDADGSGNEFVWPDGAASEYLNTMQEFEFAPYATRRLKFDFALGDLSVQQASWDVVASYARTAASRAMTVRTVKALSILQDATYMTQTGTATALGGGKWDVGTTALPYIQNTLQACVEGIETATNGVVQPKDLILVVSPNTAHQMAASPEIHDYLKQSPFSMDVIRNNLSLYGLPDNLFGIKVVVENCVKVTSAKGAARSAAYALTNTNALLLARPGGLEGTMGSFSTCQTFMKEEMTVESKRDDDGRRTVGRVVEDYDVKVAAPASGYLITACVD